MKRSTYILFGLALLIFVLALYVYRKSFKEIVMYTDLINRSHEVINGFERLSNDLKSAQIFTGGLDSAKAVGLSKVYKGNIANISKDLSALRENVLDPANKRALDTLAEKINYQLDWILTSNIRDSILLGKAPKRVSELWIIQNLIDSSISRAKVVMVQRQEKLESTLSLNNAYILAFRFFSLLILLLTMVLVFLHARQRAKSSAFLDSVLNSSQNGIISYQSVRKNGVIVDFKVVYANEAVRQHSEFDPAAIVGKRLSEFSPESRERGVFDKFCNVVKSGQVTRYEIKTGRGIFEVVIAKFMDGVTASFFNITELRNSGEELKNKIAELEQSNYELEQYAYVASHDLQEPLRKIRIFGGLIRDRSQDQLDGTNQAYLRRLIEAAERMTNLINELLKFSRLFKPERQEGPTDLNEVLKNVLKDFDLMIQEKQIGIKAENLPAIEANSLQMNQLFYNLIHNALKFSDSKPNRQIQIKSKELSMKEIEKHGSLDKQTRHYEITFEDNGIGFNQEFATQIFEIFKRLNEQHIYPGSGIGLALCRKIIFNHHGVIWAEGKEKEGAIFHVILPAKQPNAAV